VGGDARRGTSANIVRALDQAKRRGRAGCGIVGRDGSHTRQVGDEVMTVGKPLVEPRSPAGRGSTDRPTTTPRNGNR
jgi:phosphoheptose isomerase